jgi:hypothetical protein
LYYSIRELIIKRPERVVKFDKNGILLPHGGWYSSVTTIMKTINDLHISFVNRGEIFLLLEK